jgi:hypothetical protein
MPRRFPPPWSIDELEACFVVIDSAGQKLAYIYFEEEPRPAIGGQVAHEGRGWARHDPLWNDQGGLARRAMGFQICSATVWRSMQLAGSEAIPSQQNQSSQMVDDVPSALVLLASRYIDNAPRCDACHSSSN